MRKEAESLRNIKMLVLDVDGILTDCRIWMDSNGDWKRLYSIRDGVGIKRLIESGYTLAVITGSDAPDIRARMKVLGIHHLFEGKLDKLPSFHSLLERTGFVSPEVAYMGDDYFDIPILKEVGFSATVPEAMEEVCENVQYITRRTGGNGAVREVCDLIYLYGHFAKEKTA